MLWTEAPGGPATHGGRGGDTSGAGSALRATCSLRPAPVRSRDSVGWRGSGLGPFSPHSARPTQEAPLHAELHPPAPLPVLHPEGRVRARQGPDPLRQRPLGQLPCGPGEDLPGTPSLLQRLSLKRILLLPRPFLLPLSFLFPLSSPRMASPYPPQPRLAASGTPFRPPQQEKVLSHLGVHPPAPAGEKHLMLVGNGTLRSQSPQSPSYLGC